MYVKTFKGYKDKKAEIDRAVNEWVRQNRDKV